MGKKAGALLWNRQQLAFGEGEGKLPVGVVVAVDTGLAQPNQSFGDYSPGEPALDAAGDIGSRVQVIPMASIGAWAGGSVEHSEPYVADGKIMVDFLALEGVTINVLFWDPHSMIGPGDADKYGGMPMTPPPS